MLPISFLHSCKYKYIDVALKTGTLYRGILSECDNFMNFRLESVNVMTWVPGMAEPKVEHMDQVLIRGSSVKYVTMPKEILDTVKARRQEATQQAANHAGNRNQYRQGGQQNQHRDYNQGGYQRRGGGGGGNRPPRGRGGGRDGYRNNNAGRFQYVADDD